MKFDELLDIHRRGNSGAIPIGHPEYDIARATGRLMRLMLSQNKEGHSTRKIGETDGGVELWRGKLSAKVGRELTLEYWKALTEGLPGYKADKKLSPQKQSSFRAAAVLAAPAEAETTEG